MRSKNLRRAAWISAGLGAAMLNAGCDNVILNGGCEDLSALRFTPSVRTLTPSRAPIEARFAKDGRLASVRGDFDAPGANLPDAARRFLDTEREALRLPAGLEWGDPVVRYGRGGAYATFQPTYDGLPVYQGQLTVHAHEEGAERRIHSLVFSTPPELAPRKGPWLAEADALQAALDTVGSEQLNGEITITRVVVTEPAPGRYAYAIRVPSASPRGLFEVLLDGETGELLQAKDLLRYADGEALVYDPSPVGSTGNVNLNDIGDAASAALDAARISVVLQDLDGSGNLRGPFVDARGPAARANAADLIFNFNRNDDRFEEVMAYFHIDRAQRRIQALGFTNVNNRRQVAIANSIPDDNSFYSPNNLTINFGTGGVDDAEDADIIVHEYGHSVQDNQGLGFGGDSGALGEGFGDYLAAAVADSTSPQISDPFCVGDWDATFYDNRNPPCLRRVDEPKHFPESLFDGLHADGEIFSGTMFDLRSQLGADIVDTLVLEANFSLAGSPTFARAAEAILAADEDLFGGEHVEVINRTLIDHGMLRTITPGLPQGVIEETVVQNIDLCQLDCPNNFDEETTISIPGAFGLRVNFEFFAMEQDNGCFEDSCDNVYLYDAAGNLFQILSGDLGTTSSVAIPGDTVRVRVVTDRTTTSGGFLISSVDVLSACE